jgi:hypothetical protein
MLEKRSSVFEIIQENVKTLRFHTVILDHNA